MAKKKCVPVDLTKLVEDLKAAGLSVQAVVADLLAVWSGQCSSDKAVSCGDDGEDDPCCCCDGAIRAQLCALVCMLQCSCCLDQCEDDV